MNARVLAILSTVILLAGCASRAPRQAMGARTAGTTAIVTGVPAAEDHMGAHIVMPPNPGPFKNIDIKNSDGTTTEGLQSRGEVGKSGGTLTLSTFGSGPKTFNCWAASDVESHGICLLMFERLVELDAWTGEAYPRLAKTIEISPDKKTYTITLRKGLKWSDGEPLTADDVAFTFGTLVANGYGNSSQRDILSVYGKFPKVEKVDDLTVRFSTQLPFAPFLSSLKSVPIAPKHVFQAVLKRPLNQFNTFWDINMNPDTMVASGPFMLKRYVPGQRVELVRNPNYFMADAAGTRLPYLDRFVIAVVPEQNTQLLKFYGGEIDMLDIRSVRGSDVGLMKQRERDPNLNFSMHNLGPDDGTVFFMVNMCRRKNPKTGKDYVDPIKQKWFNNQKFRVACSHALDRRRIIDNALKGVGTPLFTSESPSAIYQNKTLPSYTQDLTLAAQLLKEGGFVLKDGKLYDDAGHRVEFNLLTNAGNTTRDAICVSIADTLGKLGMKCNYQPVDFNILVDKLETSLDWDSSVMGLSGSKTEPYDGANVWKSDGRLHMFDQRLPNDKGATIVTDARDWEKKIDQLFDKGATTIGFAQRKPIFDEYQKIVYDQQPFIYIESPLDIVAIRNTIKNYKPTPLGINYTPMGSLHNVEEIFSTAKSARQAK